MSKVPFEHSAARATASDPRYPADAYFFLRDALDFTLSAVSKGQPSQAHVSGTELCHGVRKFALEQYGPMVPTIFDAWGLRTTRDIGELVFNLIKAGAFSKSDTDRIEDFENVFTFDDAFVKPFQPVRSSQPAAQKSSTSS
jgi:uncharacterized repeat protein (TIGR04138 family)